MSQERLKVLLDHPDMVEKIRSVPRIIWEEGEFPLPKSTLSMKTCFTKDQLDSRHVDPLVLKKIARSTARLMKDLRDRDLYPGLLDMKDMYIDMEGGDYKVFLTHPERFQIYDMEQDYEWYPEDERLLPDLVYFDREAQDKANQRFLFRILVGSSRGNIHFPPVRSEMDYGELFYNILPDEWKGWMETGKVVTCEEFAEALTRSIRAEETFAHRVREKDRAARSAQLDDRLDNTQLDTRPGLASEEEQDQFPGGVVNILYIVLRTDLDCADAMSRLLYNMQERVEAEASLRKCQVDTAIVHGNGAVKARDFCRYPLKFRFQIPGRIEEYSMGEALVIASALLGKARQETERGQEPFRVIILMDGRIPNDRIFRAGLEALQTAVEEDVPIYVDSAGDTDCEACENLKSLSKERNGRI